MKPRIRPLSSLYFRWGRSIGLEAEDVAIALEDAGVITMVSHDKYVEVKNERLSPELYEEIVMNILTDYATREKLEAKRNHWLFKGED